jgi:hypothetical protein
VKERKNSFHSAHRQSQSVAEARALRLFLCAYKSSLIQTLIKHSRTHHHFFTTRFIMKAYQVNTRRHTIMKQNLTIAIAAIRYILTLTGRLRAWTVPTESTARTIRFLGAYSAREDTVAVGSGYRGGSETAGSNYAADNYVGERYREGQL